MQELRLLIREHYNTKRRKIYIRHDDDGHLQSIVDRSCKN